MKRNEFVMPVVKWVGGKRQLLEQLKLLLPNRIAVYCEPFVGGGAMLFALQKQNVWVNDINAELINLYKVIQDDVEKLIDILREHKNDADYFYKIRNLDRDKKKYQTLSNAQRAARIVYLNKTCYNGLFRVNNAGEFNSPFGRYKNPNIVNAPILRAVSEYFRNANISFSTSDYADVLQKITNHTFVYLDPPYDPASDTSNFTGYAKGGFDRNEQIRLRECCDDLNRRGVKFMLSNSATNFIKNQYSKYNITIVKAKRAINSNASKRGIIDEIIVRNYDR
jgi:DNA adenine methylase